ncbi:MAG: lamin tail domain-containing protein [Bacteroidales bacterium]|nr:lamin tail domain-containing protein [Bacteroidales bacterium]
MKKILFAALALVVVMASCVKDPQYPGVTISNVTYTPTAVQADNDVTVMATITSFNDFIAKLVYTIGEQAPVEVVMTEGTEKGLFTAVIPGQADDVTVSFYIVAEGELVAKSPVMEYTVGAVALDYSVLRLNELNGNDKFIELYNSGAEALFLNGVYIEKDGTQNWVADNTVSIEAGSYLLLYSEDVSAAHEGYPESLIFHSGLSAKKNVRIQLFTPAGESIDDFNLVDIDQNAPEFIPYSGSYSLNADGSWYYADPTPGEANLDGTVQVMGLEGGPEGPNFHNLILNELNGDTKFIEIYNKGNLDLPLEGLYIEKDDKDAPIWIGDATITVPAHGYVVLYSEDVVADHPELEGTNYIFGSGLSGKKAIRIALFLADGTQLDIFTRCPDGGTWGDAMSNVAPQSYARTPDGGDWKLADPTPGEANPADGEPIPQE